ncbi:helix-turn-helix domain-containing protein [Streptomyces sp. NPDC091289]|uniref:helix-turn-helix domain-containing protein n=1 Tax=Streptomyces sp. NPDC091289 TaxID=3365989 RepID=UPI0037FA8BA3
MRFLRTRSGLTLNGLAERTSYSRSSWERYLNGKAVPPRAALNEFAAAVGVAVPPLQQLREEEERSWRSGPGNGPPPHDGAERESEPLGADGDRKPAEGAAVPEKADVPGREHRKSVTLVSMASAFLALVAGILLGAWMFGGNEADRAGRQSAGSDPGCTDYECRNKDSQRVGCHLGAWTAAATWSGRTYVELRYSPRCRAAWARITDAEVGDTARVEGPKGVNSQRSVTYENDIYSPMVEAPYPAAARACGVLGGKEVCTPSGGPSPLPPALTDEREPARRAAPTDSGKASGEVSAEATGASGR